MSASAITTNWRSISAILDGEPAPEWAQTVAHWIRYTIGEPVAGLGREGALCPFVPRALELGSLFTCDAMTTAPRAVRGVIETAKGTFGSTFPLEGEADNLKALIIAFPHLPRSDWPTLKAARTAVKSHFIANGFTLSEFHDDSDDRSVRNPEIRIGHAPIPCIIVRRLQVHDVIFLRSQPALYPIYLRRMKASHGNG